MDVNAVIENFKNVVLKHYVDFHGRARRSEFWWYMLVYLIIYVVLYALTQFVAFFGIIHMIVALGLLLPTLAVEVRRLHDIGKSGWWILLPLVPAVLGGIFTIMFMLTAALILYVAALACSILLIYWWAQPGTAGQNNYGPDPKKA